MKKVALTLTLAMLIVGITLAGCAPKSGGTTQTPASTPTTTPAPSTAPSATPSGAPAPQATTGGAAWSDIPIYPSLRQVQEKNIPFPPTANNIKAEFRYYETGDAPEKVVTYYKSQMPANGWEQAAWTEAPQVAMGGYTKSQEEHIAWVWVFAAEGKTQVMLGRASKE